MILENKRLALCAEMIAADPFTDSHGLKRAADVGTDHGYLAAFLAAENICERVTACDINEMPLASAGRTVRENGLNDRVRLVLSDGLDSVTNDGFTHIICAGMGGELIAKIIDRCGFARETHLVLQPMTKADALRKYLYEAGFRVIRELAVRDGDFVYSVMLAGCSDELIDYPCDERYLAAGRLKAGERDASEYMKMRAERLKRAGNGMLSGSPAETKARGRALIGLAEKLLIEAGQTPDLQG